MKIVTKLVELLVIGEVEIVVVFATGVEFDKFEMLVELEMIVYQVLLVGEVETMDDVELVVDYVVDVLNILVVDFLCSSSVNCMLIAV